jgi:leucyl aminopeptidase
MIDQKSDKSGASVVVSILHSLRLKKINLVAVLPMVENVINGNATKPGDVFKSYDGKTVEIMDPDAEGRLIIADAIAYATKNFKVDYILDFATLTSSASMVNCDTAALYYTTCDELGHLIYTIGEATGDRVWRHPPWPEYKVQTVSPVADVRNAHFECTKAYSSFMAAMFISNFVPDDLQGRWVHFDIGNNEVNNYFMGNGAMVGTELVKVLADRGSKHKPIKAKTKSKSKSKSKSSKSKKYKKSIK